MFDTTILKPTQFVPTKVDVHEHRAPTDKSVELLSEFEQKAREKLLSVNRLDNNTLSAQWSLHRDCAAIDDRIVVRFYLNGKEFMVDTPHERFQGRKQTDSVRAAVQTIADAISREIVCGLLASESEVRSQLTR